MDFKGKDFDVPNQGLLINFETKKARFLNQAYKKINLIF